MNQRNKSFDFQIIRDRNFFIPLTDQPLLLYVIRGNLTVAEHTSYQLEADDFSLVNSGAPLEAAGSEGTVFSVISFGYQAVHDYIDPDHSCFFCNSAKENSVKYEKLRHLIGELLCEYYVHPTAMSAQKASIFLRLLHDLVTFFSMSGNSASLPLNSSGNLAVSYVQEHCTEKLSLESVAKQFYMSPSAFSRYFKKACGISFIQYLTTVRLHYALRDLVYSDKSITTIAMDYGFSGVSIFDRVFTKRFEISPSEYRKQAWSAGSSEKTADQMEELEGYLSRKRMTIVQESYAQVNRIHIDGSIRRPYKNPWNQVIGLGPIASLNNTKFRNQMMDAKKTLHMTHGRIWGLFSEKTILREGHAVQNLNFYVLDHILDLMVECGFKPVLYIENEPTEQVKDINQIKKRFLEELFLTKEEMLQVLDSFFSHLTFRYGTEEVNTWMVEFWYDKYSETFLGLPGSITRYYDEIVSVIRSWVPEIAIGGCGLGSSIGEEFFRSLMEDWSANRYQPDFLTVNCFPIRSTPLKGLANRQTLKDFFRKEILSDYNILRELSLQDIPIYVMSWNLSFSNQNFFNDSCGKAALMAHIMVDELETVKLASYQVLSDVSQSYATTFRTLNGASGLLSLHEIKKPSYYALEFISSLYPLLVAKGDHYIITANTLGHFRILLMNHKNLGAAYYAKKESDNTPESVDSLYENKDELEITLMIDQVPNGAYCIRKRSVSPENNDLLQKWLSLSVHGNLSIDDLRYLRDISIANRQNLMISVTDHTLTLIQRLTCHEICLLEVFPNNEQAASDDVILHR